MNNPVLSNNELTFDTLSKGNNKFEVTKKEILNSGPFKLLLNY